MTPRATWSGAIQLGLLTIPVKLYKAADDRGGIQLNMLHADCGQRIQMRKTCPEHGETDKIVKGYEYAKGEYVVLSDEEIDSLKIESLKTLEVSQFIPLDRLPFPRGTYYVAPDKLGVKAFGLLRRVMLDADVQAIAKVTFRDREQLAAIAPHGDIMAITTMHWPEEIREAPEVPVKVSEPSQAEVGMARALVDSMTGEFDANAYRDAGLAALTSLIEDKIAGRTPTVTPSEEKPVEPPPDLTALLAASIKEKR